VDEWNNGGRGSVTISIAAAARRGVFSIATTAARRGTVSITTIPCRGTVSITTIPCRGTVSSTAFDVSQTPRGPQITLRTNFWRGRRECFRSSVL